MVIATEFLLNIQINAGVNVYLKISMVSALVACRLNGLIMRQC